MLPLVVILLLAGGVYYVAIQRQKPAALPPAQRVPPGGPEGGPEAGQQAPFAQPPGPRQAFFSEGDARLAIVDLPQEWRVPVEQLLARVAQPGPPGQPALRPDPLNQLATQIEAQPGLGDAGRAAAALLRQKALELGTGTAVQPGTRDMFVMAPSGLRIREQPSVESRIFAVAPYGHSVRVAEIMTLGPAAGWARISSLNTQKTGFACNTCPEGGRGPWLSDVPPPPLTTGISGRFPVVG